MFLHHSNDRLENSSIYFATSKSVAKKKNCSQIEKVLEGHVLPLQPPSRRSYAYTTLYLSRNGNRLNLSHLGVINRETLLSPILLFILLYYTNFSELLRDN